MINRLASIFLFFAFCGAAQATVTLTVGVGVLFDRNSDPIDTGATFAIIASRGNSDFEPLQAGDIISQGQDVGGLDDVVVAVTPDANVVAQPFAGGTSLTGSWSGLSLESIAAGADASNWNPGDPLALVFFDRDVTGAPLVADEYYGIVESGVTPADGADGGPSEFASFNSNSQVIPESSSALLGLIGLSTLLLRRRR